MFYEGLFIFSFASPIHRVFFKNMNLQIKYIEYLNALLYLSFKKIYFFLQETCNNFKRRQFVNKIKSFDKMQHELISFVYQHQQISFTAYSGE